MANPIKYTPAFLAKLEALLKEAGYTIRSEKGNFRSGQCVLLQSQVLVVNKFASVENKVQFLVELVRSEEIDPDKLSDSARVLLSELRQTEIRF
jgi:hypothetical protein